MSKYQTIETKMKTRASIEAALTQLGIPFETHDAAQPLVGYMGDQRTERAEIIVRRKDIDSASNDLGFARQPDGTYTAVISDYDRGTRAATMVKQVGNTYNQIEYVRVAKLNGLTVVNKKDVNGKVQVTLRGYRRP